MTMRMRRGGSAAPSFALTAQTLDGLDLLTDRVVDGLGAFQRCLVMLVNRGEHPVGLAEDMGSLHEALKRMGRGEG